jgi:hypothetical protein
LLPASPPRPGGQPAIERVDGKRPARLSGRAAPRFVLESLAEERRHE